MKTSVKNKRGIRIQTRIILSAVILLFQILFLFAVLYNVSRDSALIYAASQVFGVATVVYILCRRGNPSYKITWIFFILIFPIFGTAVFLLFGGGRVMPHIRRRMEKCEEQNMPYLPENSGALSSLQYDDYPHSRQADYLMRESGYPLYKNTRVRYLSPGEKFFPEFLKELRKAEKYIFLEFFIIAEGKMWNDIYEVLETKVKQGVSVKVLFDDFGSIKRQDKGFINRLKRAGISVAVFNKIRPSVDIFMNNRNHRKIAVIDGKVAATGGINIADEYINETERFGYWLDSAVIVEGAAVKSFLVMFCNMWEFTTKEKLDLNSLLQNYDYDCKGYVLPYCDDPLNDKNPAEGIYMQILNTAQRYVYIASPYLIIDSAMISALKLAAKSGIDVRIVTPHIPDKWYVHPVTQYNYYELLCAGVKIYEYTPGFIHSKLFVSDDTVATVGTVNMDYRSFIFHFECGVWMCKTKAVKEIKDHFEEIFTQSKLITIEEWKKIPFIQKAKQAILHLFAPFM